MSFEGTVERGRLPEVLLQIAAQQSTGILTVQGEQDIIAVSFFEGDVVAADALNKTVEEGLQEVLVKRELVSREDFTILAAEHQAGGGRVMELLVERGFLTRDQLLVALRVQTYALVLEVLQWPSGEFKFYTGDEIFFEEGFERIPAEEVLIRASWDLGEAAPLDGPVPDPSTVYRRSESEDPTSVHDLTTRGKALLELVDGERTTAELVLESGLPEYGLMMILYRLEQADLVVRAAELGEAETVAEPPAPEWYEPATRPRRFAFLDKLDQLRRTAQPRTGDMKPWVSTVVGLLLMVGLVVQLHRSPIAFLCPLPWEELQRERVVRGQRALHLLRIDRAADTYYLLEGRFPVSLEVLVEEGLLNERDLREPGGRELGFLGTEAGYVVQPLDGDTPIPEEGRTDGVGGNFLLDSEFLRRPDEPERPALVLVD